MFSPARGAGLACQSNVHVDTMVQIKQDSISLRHSVAFYTAMSRFCRGLSSHDSEDAVNKLPVGYLDRLQVEL